MRSSGSASSPSSYIAPSPVPPSSTLAEKLSDYVLRPFPQTSPPRPPSPCPGLFISTTSCREMPGQREGGGEKKALLRAPLSLARHPEQCAWGKPQVEPGRGGLGGEVCAEEEGAEPFRRGSSYGFLSLD